MATLIASLGGSPDIIAEVLGLTNLETLAIYTADHPHYQEIKKVYDSHFIKSPVERVWVITTFNKNVDTYIQQIRDWNSQFCQNTLKLTFFLLPYEDINNAEQASYARECAARLVFSALKSDERVFISIAGGRKTMASDLYSAGNALGCEGFIHVIAAQEGLRKKILEFHTSAPPSDVTNNYIPLWYGSARRNNYLLHDARLKIAAMSIPTEEVLENVVNLEHFIGLQDRTIIDMLERSSRQAWNSLSHSRNTKLLRNFPVLQRLDDQHIEYLSNTIIDEQTACKIPKIDLHCHLGGCLSIREIVSIAAKTLEIEFPKLTPISLAEAKIILNEATQMSTSIKMLEHSKYLQVIAAFQGYENILERLWYGVYLDNQKFCGCGFNVYEKLGDLQGSTLLQTETAIRTTVRNLIEASRLDSCIGLEIRCSPQNYTKYNLSYQQVLRAIIDEIDSCRGEMEIVVILIASRHKDPEEIRKTIAQFVEIKENCGDPHFERLLNQYIRGFDVAGAENACPARRLRADVIEILKDCIPITIHAGETESVESIWEAVYELNADRIGHGLTLGDDASLMEKFLDRGIGIELCPSSNYQIVGYDDHRIGVHSGKQYPLKKFLDVGLRATINTDNRGISRTSLPKELIKASNLSDGGLTIIDALQLCKNSVDISFFKYETKEKLYRIANEKLEVLLSEFVSSIHDF